MKQHITFQQFNELARPNQQKVKDWVFSGFQREAEEENPASFITLAPLRVEDYCLSIGQMIEFLGDKGWFVRVEHDDQAFEPGDKQWNVFLSDGNPTMSGRSRNYWQDELVEALWEAVKDTFRVK